MCRSHVERRGADQYGFMLRKRTIDDMFFLRGSVDKYREGQIKLI